jgi:uracil-DNA glycosylase family 4
VDALKPADHSPIPKAEAPRDCTLCPRLVALREEMRANYPDWWNAPVPAFGDPEAWLAIVGLAPGRKGANRTGRPFTGDFAGDLLFATLAKFGLAEGEYRASRDDGLRLKGIVILNAVKCLPPGNKPSPREVATCGDHFLKPSFAALPRVRIFIALGRIAHNATLRVFDRKPSANGFCHGAEHQLPGGRLLIDSYHCSRQNVNTRRLTKAMFETLFERATAKNG